MKSPSSLDSSSLSGSSRGEKKEKGHRAGGCERVSLKISSTMYSVDNRETRAQPCLVSKAANCFRLQQKLIEIDAVCLYVLLYLAFVYLLLSQRVSFSGVQ